MLYRFKTSPQWVLVIALAFPAVLWAKSEEITNHQSVTQKQALPAYDGERVRPVVAIIAENRYTELTDYVIPYGVLKQSGVAEPVALATREGSIQFFPSTLRAQPEHTTAQFDAQFPTGADYVIVPAVHHDEDPVLLNWITQQAQKGATIVGVCDGVVVVANTGLLKGRSAVAHWYSFDKLKKNFPDTHWVRNKRYQSDRNVITTTGVTASIPVTLALVEAIAGTDKALSLAAEFGVASWGADHPSSEFDLSMTNVVTAAANWLAFWNRDNIAIALEPGIDEVSLALVADAFGRTYRSKVITYAADPLGVTTQRGLVLLPDKVASKMESDIDFNLMPEIPSVLLLRQVLRQIERDYGEATAKLVSLQLEWPLADWAR